MTEEDASDALPSIDEDGFTPASLVRRTDSTVFAMTQKDARLAQRISRESGQLQQFMDTLPPEEQAEGFNFYSSEESTDMRNTNAKKVVRVQESKRRHEGDTEESDCSGNEAFEKDVGQDSISDSTEGDSSSVSEYMRTVKKLGTRQQVDAARSGHGSKESAFSKDGGAPVNSTGRSPSGEKDGEEAERLRKAREVIQLLHVFHERQLGALSRKLTNPGAYYDASADSHLHPPSDRVVPNASGAFSPFARLLYAPTPLPSQSDATMATVTSDWTEDATPRGKPQQKELDGVGMLAQRGVGLVLEMNEDTSEVKVIAGKYASLIDMLCVTMPPPLQLPFEYPEIISFTYPYFLDASNLLQKLRSLYAKGYSEAAPGIVVDVVVKVVSSALSSGSDGTPPRSSEILKEKAERPTLIRTSTPESNCFAGGQSSFSEKVVSPVIPIPPRSPDKVDSRAGPSSSPVRSQASSSPSEAGGIPPTTGEYLVTLEGNGKEMGLKILFFLYLWVNRNEFVLYHQRNVREELQTFLARVMRDGRENSLSDHCKLVDKIQDLLQGFQMQWDAKNVPPSPKSQSATGRSPRKMKSAGEAADVRINRLCATRSDGQVPSLTEEGRPSPASKQTTPQNRAPSTTANDNRSVTTSRSRGLSTPPMREVGHDVKLSQPPQEMHSTNQGMKAMSLVSKDVITNDIDTRKPTLAARVSSSPSLPNERAGNVPSMPLPGKRSLSVVGCSAMDIASQLTLVERRIICGVPPADFLRYAREGGQVRDGADWGSKTGQREGMVLVCRGSKIVVNSIAGTEPSIAATVDDLLRHFSVMIRRIQIVVLSFSELNPRAVAIGRLIEAAHICMEMRNLSSAMQIVRGLEAPAVDRLRSTWERVPSSAMAKFQNLQRMLRDDESVLQNSEEPAVGSSLYPPKGYPVIIPIPAVCHRLLSSTHISIFTHDGMINYSKLCIVGEAIRDIYKLSTSFCDIEEKPEVRATIWQCPLPLPSTDLTSLNASSFQAAGASAPGSSSNFSCMADRALWDRSCELEEVILKVERRGIRKAIMQSVERSGKKRKEKRSSMSALSAGHRSPSVSPRGSSSSSSFATNYLSTTVPSVSPNPTSAFSDLYSYCGPVNTAQVDIGSSSTATVRRHMTHSNSCDKFQAVAQGTDVMSEHHAMTDFGVYPEAHSPRGKTGKFRTIKVELIDGTHTSLSVDENSLCLEAVSTLRDKMMRRRYHHPRAEENPFASSAIVEFTDCWLYGRKNTLILPRSKIVTKHSIKERERDHVLLFRRVTVEEANTLNSFDLTLLEHRVVVQHKTMEQIFQIVLRRWQGEVTLRKRAEDQVGQLQRALSAGSGAGDDRSTSPLSKDSGEADKEPLLAAAKHEEEADMKPLKSEQQTEGDEKDESGKDDARSLQSPSG